MICRRGVEIRSMVSCGEFPRCTRARDASSRGSFRMLDADGGDVPSSLRTLRSASFTPSLRACFNCRIAHRVRDLEESVGPVHGAVFQAPERRGTGRSLRQTFR